MRSSPREVVPSKEIALTKAVKNAEVQTDAGSCEEEFPTSPVSRIVTAHLAQLGEEPVEVEDSDEGVAPASASTSENASSSALSEPGALADEFAVKALFEELESGEDARAALAIKHAGVAELNAVDEMGRNALLLTCSEGLLQAVQALLSRDDFNGINAENSIGCTALHLAAANDEPEICRAILACPRFTAGVNAENHRGQTPLDFGRQFGAGCATVVLEEAGGSSVRRRSRPSVPSNLRRPGCIGPQPVPAG